MKKAINVRFIRDAICFTKQRVKEPHTICERKVENFKLLRQAENIFHSFYNIKHGKRATKMKRGEVVGGPLRLAKVFRLVSERGESFYLFFGKIGFSRRWDQKRSENIFMRMLFAIKRLYARDSETDTDVFASLCTYFRMQTRRRRRAHTRSRVKIARKVFGSLNDNSDEIKSFLQLQQLRWKSKQKKK